MLASDLTVEVRGRALNGSGTILDRQGQILTTDLNLQAKLRWCGVGEWTLTLPGNHVMVPYLIQPGSGIIVSDSQGVVFSGPTLAPNRKRNVASPDGTLTFKGVTDEIHLQDALAFPSPNDSADPSAQTGANDIRTGTTEDLMRQYVAYNVTFDQALAGRVRGARQYVDLAGTSLGRGVTTSRSPRFQNLLELLQGLAVEGTLGFRMVQADDKILFEIVPVRDLRGTIRLDVNSGTITSEEVEIQGPALTYPIVAGQGEGIDRTMVVIQNAEVIAAETDWGRVIEGFFDRRDTDDPVELSAKALEELETTAGGTSAKIVPSDDQTMRYRYDWNVGDWITVLVDGVPDPEKWSVVTEVVLLFDASRSAVGLGVGDVTSFDPRDVQASKQDTLDSRLGYLERSLTGAGRVLFGTLDAAYRLGGPAKVIIDGTSTLTEPLVWRTPYVPNGSRRVSVVWANERWEIIGQTDYDGISGFWPFPLAGTKWSSYSAVSHDPNWNERIGATRLPTGLIALSGMIRNDGGAVSGNEILTVLPEAYRPEYEVIASTLINDAHLGLTIRPNGEVSFRQGFLANAYVTLDGVVFWAADSEATGNWVDIGTGGTSFASGFGTDSAWNTAHGFPAVYQDRYGFVWGRGLVKVLSTQSVNDTPMVNLPTAMRSYLQQHFRTVSNEAVALVGSRPSTGGIDWKPPSSGSVNSWISLYGFAICTPTANTGNPWVSTKAYSNGWQSYNEATFPRLGWLRRGDGLVAMRGLVNSGTPTAVISNLSGHPEMYPRARTLLMATMSANLNARMNIRGDFQVGTDTPRILSPGAGVSNSWVEFDSMMYVP